MGLFSRIFKPKPTITVITHLGEFTLTYSKREKNIWTNNSGQIFISIRGTDKEPDILQLQFLKIFKEEIERLEKKITKRFIKEFREAGLGSNFTNWAERFKVVAIDVMLIFEDEVYWNITFEDSQEPFAHFTLYIEGDKTTDFSIDT